MSDKFPSEIRKWIKEHNYDLHAIELMDQVNEQFGTSYKINQIKAFRKNNHLISQYDGKFVKGTVPWSKGKTWNEFMSEEGRRNSMATCFKSGDVPHNWVPIETELIKSDGYLWRKVKDDAGAGIKNWKQVHILLWESAHGTIPEGHHITFKDGDRLHISLDNLAIVSYAQNARLTRKNLRIGKELFQESLDIVDLDQKVFELKKVRK